VIVTMIAALLPLLQRAAQRAWANQRRAFLLRFALALLPFLFLRLDARLSDTT
jgi:hypothetical protein